MHKTFLALAVVAVLAAPASSAATLYNLYPNDRLIFSFTFSSVPVCSGTCDTLFPFIQTGPAFAGAPATTALYDGSTLLSSFSTGCCLFAFHTAASAFAIGGVADFTTILNGTIQGRVEYMIFDHFIQDVDLSSAYIILGHGTSNSASDDVRANVVVSIVPVREPALGWLLAGALVILALLKRFQPVLGTIKTDCPAPTK